MAVAQSASDHQPELAFADGINPADWWMMLMLVTALDHRLLLAKFVGRWIITFC